ncbi:MAG TPA: DedA family protein [Candidatus Dormibacteraeota bacterium]|nr:DedA family protein [Candidatus Dormibacteraeota bacterium]
MLAHAHYLASLVPWWLQEPTWLFPLARAVRHFIVQHQTSGLFIVILLEEIGIPLPAPGDVAITFGGYLTTTGAIPYPLAYVAVVAGAIIGSTINMTLNRRYGRRFINRFGPVLGITEERIGKAERAFQRWGPWAIIIGRHIPGLRIVLSALSGILLVPYRVFIPCVAVSATIWAAIFITLGRVLGPRARGLFGILPADLIPWLLFGLGLLAVGYLGYEHGLKPKAWRRRVESQR